MPLHYGHIAGLGTFPFAAAIHRTSEMMSEYQILTVLTAFAFLYSLVASRLERSPFSGALVYVTAGILCGPSVFRLVDLPIGGEEIRWLAELTLAVVLFSDSANADLKILRRFEAIPVRLLLVGLPLSILLGFGVGVVLYPDLSLFEVAVLAALLAPTDASLGKAIFTNESVPASTRESLNVESGLNDGICVPVVLLFLALAGGHARGWEAVELLAVLPLQAVGVGALLGGVLGGVGSVAVRVSSERGWTHDAWLQIPVIALALLCLASAEWLGGSGFIASFVGGMTFGALTRKHKHALLESAEGSGNALSMLTWFAFGTLLFSQPFHVFQWRSLLYAVASLTVVRMLPAYLSMRGLHLRVDTRLFIGWFGPRGLASIVFAVMAFDEQLPHSESMLGAAAWTIVLSVVAHGLSSNPLASLYGRRVADGSI